jgi:hypothetical protein
VQDGLLYGVGDNGGVYTIDTDDATAKLVSQLTIALNGSSFGVDFNPAADRLRIVSDSGQNLRHNVNAGGTTVLDGTLTYNSTDPATGVAGAAYTNNDMSALTATTLYDLDANLDQVAIQSPANAGMLAATGKLTVDTTASVGFDIYSIVRDGVAMENRGIASLTSSTGVSGLYRITLTTGRAQSLGRFATQNTVVDIAVPLNQL